MSQFDKYKKLIRAKHNIKINYDLVDYSNFYQYFGLHNK